MSRRWDERGTGTATGGPAPGERRRHMNRYGLPKSLPQNHFRRKSYRLSASAEMDTTRHSFGCYGHGAVRHRPGAARLGATAHGPHAGAHRLASGRMAHRHIDEMTVRLCRRSNIPRSSTLCPERGSGCGSSPSMVLARAAPSRYPSLRSLFDRARTPRADRWTVRTLCRVGLLFPTCVRGCAAQSPLIFKPGN
jgi:hypothetical protein